MTARAYALMTGIFVVALAGVVAAAIYWLGGVHAERAHYVVVAQQSVMGLHAQSTVYYRGVPVGTVSGIGFAPHDVRRTYIDIDIAPSIPITPGTYATLSTQGVTGLATVELNDNGKNPHRLPSSEDHPARIPLQNGGGFSGLRSAASQLIDKLNGVADSLQHILSGENRGRITRILVNTETLTARLGGLEKRLDASLAGLPALTQDARHSLHRIDKLTAHMTELTDSLRTVSGKMGDLADTGHAAGQELAQQTLPKLGDTLDDLQRTAKALEDLSRSLQRNPQQLLFGPTKRVPGPGEPGYQPPP